MKERKKEKLKKKRKKEKKKEKLFPQSVLNVKMLPNTRQKTNVNPLSFHVIK